MLRVARRAVSLTCPILLIVSWFWGPKWWLGLVALAGGVGAVVLLLYERRIAGADDPATLELRRKQ